MKNIKRTTLILSALLFWTTGHATAQPVAFTNVTVMDVRDGVARPDMTVVVTGNRITAAGSVDAIEVPADAHLIDGSGRFLIPGLWDMHVHTVWHDFGGSPYDLDAHFPLFLANGITGVRDTWGNAAAAEELRREIATGQRAGPRLVVAGNLLDGPRIAWPGSTSVTTPEQGRFLVDSLSTAGADFIKVYDSLLPEVYHAIVERAHEVGLPIAGHLPIAVPAREASEAGHRSMEHLQRLQLDCSHREEELQGKGPLDLPFMRELLDSYDPEKCRKLFRTFAENRTWLVPTLVLYKRHPVPDPGRFDPGEGHWYMPPIQHTAWAEQVDEAPAIPEGWGELSGEERQLVRRFFFDIKMEMVRLMNEEGVPILAGTDANADGRPPFLYAGFSLHEELELLVEAGLTPAEALRAATLEPARYLDATDSLGTVEVGKLADLVLLDANPLEDIRNTRRIRTVVADGRLFRKENILSLREQVLLENYRKALLASPLPAGAKPAEARTDTLAPASTVAPHPAQNTKAGSGEEEPVVIGETITVRSEILGEDRRIHVQLPAGYETDPDGGYPVLYVLDGDAPGPFAYVGGLVGFLASGYKLPPMIVVGIPNTNRTRDLTTPHDGPRWYKDILIDPDSVLHPNQADDAGGADAFLAFLTEELAPEIERRYRTAPFRVLLGHSLGGLFVTRALLTRPETFNAYVASSPSLSWNDREIVRDARRALAALPDASRFFYMAVGDREGIAPAADLAAVLEMHAPPSLRWWYRVNPGETHQSNSVSTYARGLSMLFADLAFAEGFLFTGDLAALEARYAKASATYGYPITPPADVLTLMGTTQLLLGRTDRAIEILERTVELYPQSTDARDALGEALEAAGRARVLPPGSGRTSIRREDHPSPKW